MSASTSSQPRKSVEVAIAVVFDRPHQRILICQRKHDTVLGGYWEFPGGKCDPGETPEACACREVLEETNLTVRAVKKLPIIDHEYPHARVRLHPFVCEHVSGEVQLLAVADARWLTPGELEGYRFPEANVPLLQAVARGYDRLIASTH